MTVTDVSDRVRPLDLYPYDNYSVILKPKAHLHYAYRIRNDSIEIELSDYLLCAPDKVISDTCKAIVRWSSGKKFVMPDSLAEYVRSDEFIIDNRPLYLKRSRTFLMTQQGKYRNLIDSVERLMEQGLVLDADIGNSYFTWTEHMAKHRFAQCNQMFRVVSVNPILDDDTVPEWVLDFVVYHEILHLRQDSTKNHRPHNAQFRSWEHMFPGYEEAEAYLRNIYDRPRSI